MTNTAILEAKPKKTAATPFPNAEHLAFEKLFGLHAIDKTQVLLINHAEPAIQAGLRNGALSAPRLSEKGRCQAMRLAMRLRSRSIDAVYTSTAHPALETALLIAASKDLPMVRAPQLREIDAYATSTNGHVTDIETAAAQALVRFINNPRWDSLRRFEPSRQFRHRVVQAIEGIIAHHLGQNVVLVTHPGVINAYLSMVLDIPRDMFFLPQHTSISELWIHQDLYVARTLNDAAHLMPTFAPR